MRTRNVFISHSWRHSGHYDRLVDLLEGRKYFSFRDYSVPEDDPLDAKTTREIREGIRGQMRPCSVMLIIAGVHAGNSKWMLEEMRMAQDDFSPRKPIIGIKPHKAKAISTAVQSQADEIVGWYTESVVAAIRKWGK